MTRLHLLASCAVTLGRFAGFSETFDQMGEYFMPLDARKSAAHSRMAEIYRSV